MSEHAMRRKLPLPKRITFAEVTTKAQMRSYIRQAPTIEVAAELWKQRERAERYRKALEEIEKTSVQYLGRPWEDLVFRIDAIVKEALKE